MRYRVLCGETLPRRLADMDRPPQCLHLWGELPEPPYVAIVGTRQATSEGAKFVRKLAKNLGRAGVTVISGGALGIDAAAHEGALDAGTPTLVVAPAGFDKPYPPSHAELFGRIVQAGGGYLSLVPAERGPTRPSFFRRNAVLAALCDALVIGEAHFRSGARNAAGHARRAGRAVFSVPSAAWNPRGRGSNLELRAGARWVEEPRDVLDYLVQSGQLTSGAGGIDSGPVSPGSSPSLNASRGRACQQLSFGVSWSGARPEAVDAVGSAVRAGATHADLICEETGLTAAEVHVALLELLLQGKVEQDSSGVLRVRLASISGCTPGSVSEDAP